MIINNTYFFGDIYIPHAKPSITDPVTQVDSQVLDFINKYSEICGVKIFGPQLFAELKLNLDSNESSWVDAGADVRWDELVNGLEYTDPNSGLTVEWKGIRFQSDFDSTKYYSFLAEYVYFFHEQYNWITKGESGDQVEMSENSERRPPTDKAVRAWNRFVTLVQGEYANEQVVHREDFGYGLDYFQGGVDVSLYKFIADQNQISTDKFANFNPKKWKRLDIHGLV